MRIALLWHSLASGNLGVDALTAANMAIVRGELSRLDIDSDLIVVGMRDNHDGDAELPPRTELFVIDGRSMLSPGGYWSLLKQVDCVIDIGAGDSFAQIYGWKRFGYLWLTKAMAILRGVPLILAPQTIGPFTGWLYIVLARWVMSRAEAVVARDPQSLVEGQRIAPAARLVEATDVALQLPYQSLPAAPRKKMRVGINASGLLYNLARTGNNRFGLSYDYAELIDNLIVTLTARSDVVVELISHATSRTDAIDDDGALADRLAVAHPGVVRVPDFPNASAAKTYISGLDFLVAGRMHACIAAFSSGVPVVPTAYSRKFTGLFGSLGYAYVMPMQGLDDAAALEFVLEQLSRRTELRKALDAGMGRVDELLGGYRQVLGKAFAKLVP